MHCQIYTTEEGYYRSLFGGYHVYLGLTAHNEYLEYVESTNEMLRYHTLYLRRELSKQRYIKNGEAEELDNSLHLEKEIFNLNKQLFQLSKNWIATRTE